MIQSVGGRQARGTEMDIQLGTERIFALEVRVGEDDARQRAMDKRTNAFGGGIGSLLQRPKAEDVALTGSQLRLEPIWHVVCRARYVYERSRDYAVTASTPEVREVTILGTTYPVAETGTSNIFMVKDGVVMTPVANRSFLAGITRSRVIRLLREAGVEVLETALTVDDFLDADEIFSTGNYSKVVPVNRIEDRAMQPGPINTKARKLYWEWAHA